MLNFNLITVPHSGTRFFDRFFMRVGFKRITPSSSILVGDSTIRFHLMHFPPYKTPPGTAEDYAGIIMPGGYLRFTVLRDPYLVALSHIETMKRNNDTKTNPIERLISQYDYAIHCCARNKFIYADIHCPADKRQSHLTALLKQLNVYDSSFDTPIQEYSSMWTPVGKQETEHKEEYLRTGTLPSEFKWWKLDKAVTWYNRIKMECVYDNITS